MLKRIIPFILMGLASCQSAEVYEYGEPRPELCREIENWANSPWPVYGDYRTFKSGRIDNDDEIGVFAATQRDYPSRKLKNHSIGLASIFHFTVGEAFLDATACMDTYRGAIATSRFFTPQPGRRQFYEVANRSRLLTLEQGDAACNSFELDGLDARFGNPIPEDEPIHYNYGCFHMSLVPIPG